MFFCTGSSSAPTTTSASCKLCSSQKVRRTRRSFWECCGSETLQLLSHSELDISGFTFGRTGEGESGSFNGQHLWRCYCRTLEELS